MSDDADDQPRFTFWRVIGFLFFSFWAMAFYTVDTGSMIACWGLAMVAAWSMSRVFFGLVVVFTLFWLAEIPNGEM